MANQICVAKLPRDASDSDPRSRHQVGQDTCSQAWPYRPEAVMLARVEFDNDSSVRISTEREGESLPNDQIDGL